MVDQMTVEEVKKKNKEELAGGSRASSSRAQLTIHAYDWKIDDHIDSRDVDTKLTINGWCLDRNSEPCLVRIEDYPASCRIMLPRLGKNKKWNARKAKILFQEIQEKLNKDGKNTKPIKHQFAKLKRLYNYSTKKTPFITVYFRHISHMWDCKTRLDHGFYSQAFGKLDLTVHEADIKPIWKFLADADINYTQWFNVKAKKVTSNKISTLDNEYIISWLDIQPIDRKISGSWVSMPTVASVDIEAYAQKHSRFPCSLLAKDVAFMMSVVVQNLGQPESTCKFYGLIIGDVGLIPEEKLKQCHEVYNAATEYDMVTEAARIFQKNKITVIAGHNVLGFDFNYLNDRLERLGNEWPRIGYLKDYKTGCYTKTWESDAFGHNVMTMLDAPGIITLDTFPIIKRDHKLMKYDLDFIGKKFVGQGKVPVKAQEMFKIYEEFKHARAMYFEMKKQQAISRGETPVEEDEEESPTYEHLLSDAELNQTKRIAGITSNPIEAMLLEQSISVKPDTEQKDEITLAYEKAQKAMQHVMVYCWQDATIVLKVIIKLNIWTTLVGLAAVTNVSIMELFTSGQQVRCMSQLYREAYKNGVVIVKRNKPGRGFSGGFCFTPKAGLKPIVIFLDFASLYPNIIRAMNICYTTYVPPEKDDLVPDEDCNIIEFEQDESKFATEGAAGLDGEAHDMSETAREAAKVELEIDPTGKKKKKAKKAKKSDDEDEEAEKPVVMKKYRFKFVKPHIRVGLLPQMCGKLIDERTSVRKEMESMKKGSAEFLNANALQLGLKVSTNSFFGFLGVINGYMPFIEGAMAITAVGREKIQETNRRVEEKYNVKVVYGDTDSSVVDVYEKVKGDKAAAVRLGYTIVDDINGQTNGVDDPTKIPWFPRPLTVAFEKAAKMYILTAKRYAYIPITKAGEYNMDPNAFVAKGIVLARRDFCEWMTDCYRDVLMGIMTNRTLAETLNVVVTAINKLFNDEVPPQKLATVKKLGAHYKLANYPMKLFAQHLVDIGRPAEPGERLEFVVVVTDDANAKLGHKMRLIETYEENKAIEPIDNYYYIEKVMANQVNQLIQVGYKKEIKKTKKAEICFKQTNRHKTRYLDEPVTLFAQRLKAGKKLKKVLKKVDKALKVKKPKFRIVAEAA